MYTDEDGELEIIYIKDDKKWIENIW
jgi:hypothetical protein